MSKKRRHHRESKRGHRQRDLPEETSKGKRERDAREPAVQCDCEDSHSNNNISVGTTAGPTDHKTTHLVKNCCYFNEPPLSALLYPGQKPVVVVVVVVVVVGQLNEPAAAKHEQYARCRFFRDIVYTINALLPILYTLRMC